MRVVSNASPLINLARIGELDLLRHLYDRLLIPQAVWQEVVVEGAGQPGAAAVEAADWIETREVADHDLVRVMQQSLDAGEAEAIALALEVEADLLLMDERLGRATAQHVGLRYIGLVGVLITAKRRGLVDSIKSHLAALRDAAGFRLSEALYSRVLRDEGEL